VNRYSTVPETVSETMMVWDDGARITVRIPHKATPIRIDNVRFTAPLLGYGIVGNGATTLMITAPTIMDSSREL